jgi:pyruvate ferredoxin oxidoreductase gamma subunit
MIEIRFHGRGGQGAVTSAELLALAAIEEERYAQAIPSFGPERRGAPVVAFARIDDHNIRLRTGVYNPDIVVVLDSSLLELPAVKAGLKPASVIIANTTKSEEEIRRLMHYDGALALVDASSIAIKELGVNITNTCMLGALVRAMPVVKIASLFNPTHHRFGKNAEKNIAAMQKACEKTVVFNESSPPQAAGYPCL